MEKRKLIGIVGTGTIGPQIATHFLLNNFDVIIKTRDENKIELIKNYVLTKINKNNNDGLPEILKNKFLVTRDFSQLKQCDLIIEASIENLEIKEEIFRNLSAVCDKKTIFSSNTSSLSINKLAESTDRQDRFIGLHFFNPVHKMKLLEITPGNNTSIDTVDYALSVAKLINKTPIISNDTPGFIVNRLLIPQINYAIKLSEENNCSYEDIDNAMKLGLNHPMGPFQLADYIGLDVCLSILEILFSEFNDSKYKPSNLLIKLVSENKLGKKTGLGFYEY